MVVITGHRQDENYYAFAFFEKKISTFSGPMGCTVVRILHAVYICVLNISRTI